jgi:predicted GNAT family acetyltransferase
MTGPPAIEHRPHEQRFVCLVDGLESSADYRREGLRLLMTHTGVDPRLQGRGIAAALVAAAFDHARAHGLKVVPLCSYVSTWARRHPEVRDLLA